MLSFITSGFTLMLLLTGTGVSCQKLTAVKDEESSLEGSSVTLSYNYSQQARGDDYFFWYRQHPGEPPEFLMSISGLDYINTADSLKSETRFSTELKGKQVVDLQISSAAETDSAVYYCAVRPNTGGVTKMMFGAGTRLTIETKAEVKPEFYELENNGTRICLATEFTRQKALKESELNQDLFTGNSSNIPASGSGRYSQVVFLQENDTCEETGEESPCEATVEPGPIVNMAAFTINCLRLVFLKTVVFNVLMTLRLWISP